MSKICPACSAEIQDTAKFCSKCGQMLEEESVPVLHTEMPEEQPVSVQLEEQPVSVQPEQQNAIPVSHEASKEIVKSMKEQLKAAKKAEKAAKKAEAAQRKSMYKDSPDSVKVSPLGVFAAVILSMFLVFNLVICFAFSLVLGLAGSDISNFAINVGRQALSVDSLLESVEALGSKDMRELAENLLSGDTDLKIRAGGESYTLELTEETLGVIENVVLSDDGPAEMLLDAIEEYMDIAFAGVGVCIAYVAFVIILLVFSIIACLGKKRRAFVVPGLIFIITGVILFAVSMLGVFLPDILKAAGFDAVFSLEYVATCTLAVSASISLIGVLFTVIGVTAKKYV